MPLSVGVQSQHVAAGALDGEGEVAFALQSFQPEHFRHRGFEIDVDELQLRLEFDALFGGSKPDGSLDQPRKRAIPDRQRQLAAAHIGRDGGSSELGGPDRDLGG